MVYSRLRQLNRSYFCVSNQTKNTELWNEIRKIDIWNEKLKRERCRLLCCNPTTSPHTNQTNLVRERVWESELQDKGYVDCREWGEGNIRMKYWRFSQFSYSIHFNLVSNTKYLAPSITVLFNLVFVFRKEEFTPMFVKNYLLVNVSNLFGRTSYFMDSIG